MGTNRAQISYQRGQGCAVRVLVPAEVGGLLPFVKAGVFGPAEVHAAAAIAGQGGGHGGSLWPDERVVLAAALAVWAPLHGHACIDLDTVVDAVAEAEAFESADLVADELPGNVSSLPWPDPKVWRRALVASSTVRVAHHVDPEPVLDDHPLVLCGTLLYTQRQWVDECMVATTLRRLADAVANDVSPTSLDLLNRLLPDERVHAGSQYAAAHTALTSRLSVIVGGPGTGKTYTISCLLAALAAGAPDRPPRVGLAAPTGKAAARMTDAVAYLGSAGLGVDLPDGVADLLAGVTAVTVHRLLGPRPDHRTRFKHDQRNPLPYDVIVVDETSMLPLSLMARLLEAVPESARLVLVGDPDQLRSIDAGAVIGDVVRAADATGAPLHRNVVRVTTQHRTGVSSPIGPLAEAIRRGRADDALHLLRRGDAEERLMFVEVDEPSAPRERSGDPTRPPWPGAHALSAVRDAVGDAFAAARDAAQRGESAIALDEISQVRILCAHRRGPAGVAMWNHHVESWLLDDPDVRFREYSGRAVLATRNDPRTGIVNGDAGVLVRMFRPDGTAGALRAVFRRGDAVRDFAPAELDEMDTAFAVTIHKSQGSEYDTVVVVHPPSDSPLIARELLYTAATRASRRLVIVGSAESIRRAVETPTRRVTGLVPALR